MDSRLQVDVLIHRRELWRPTSTGRLISRVLSTARAHTYSNDLPLSREAVVRPGRTLWILHPQGEAPPPKANPEELQVLLLDGNWREASRMRRAVEDWGRLTRLPEGYDTRFRLRSQHAPGMYSTVETLLILLESLGEPEAARELRLQFELHVYAGLRTRGAVNEAAEFLGDSPIRDEFAGLLQELHRRRPAI